MWLSKPLYEALPYYYVGVGFASLLTSLYVDYWFWPEVCMVVGLAGLNGGIVVWLKRRDYRQSRSRVQGQP